MAGETQTYTLEGQTYTVPAGTSMDELDEYIKSQETRSSDLTRQTQDTAKAAGVSTVAPIPLPPVEQSSFGRPYLSEKRPSVGELSMDMTRALANQPATTPEKQAEGEAGKKAGFEAAGIQTAASVAGPAIGSLIGETPIAETAGRFLRTPEGALKPWVNAGARGAGAAIGYRVAGAPGAFAGGFMGPGLMEEAVPARPYWEPGGVAPTLPSASEFYENRGAELAKRPDELTQAVREGRASRLSTRIPKRPAELQGNPSPFQGLMSSSSETTRALPERSIGPKIELGESPTTTTGKPVEILPKSNSNLYVSRKGRTWTAGDLASMPREQLAGEYAKELQKPTASQDQEWLQALRAEAMRNTKGLYSSSPDVIRGGGRLRK